MWNTIKTFLSYLMYMIPGFLGIGLMLLVHETGHFIMAKILSVDVEEFGIGIGPKIFKKDGKNTRFVLSLIPFGGHCRLSGSEDLAVALKNNEEDMKNTENGSFFGISPVKKFFIFLSGPVMNFLFGILLLFFTYSLPTMHVSNKAFVTPISEYPTLFQDKIEQPMLKKGDLIISMNGEDIRDYEDFEKKISYLKGQNISLSVLRGGNVVDITLIPQILEGEYSYGITLLQKCIIGRSECDELLQGDEITSINGFDTPYTLDFFLHSSDENNITFLRDGKENKTTLMKNGSIFPFSWKSDLVLRPDSDHPLKDAISKGIAFSLSITKSIGKLLSFQLKEALQEISGPFTSASRLGKISTLAFKDSSSSGFRAVFYLLSIVSFSLCIANLIPIPSFDGGGMLECIAEMIRGKPLKTKSYVILHIAGVTITWIIIIVMNAFPILSKIFHFWSSLSKISFVFSFDAFLPFGINPTGS